MNWADQAGCRQNDQAIIVELENNPVMIDQFLIGWDWLLTGSEPFLHNKTVFYLSLPPSLPPSLLSPHCTKSVLTPQTDSTFLTSHDFRSCVETATVPQCHSAPPGPNCLFILHNSTASLSSPSSIPARGLRGKKKNLSCFITLKLQLI